MPLTDTASTTFGTVRIEGAILPPDLLARVATGEADGIAPADYHLAGERVADAVSRSWNRLIGTWAAFKSVVAAAAESDTLTTVTRERWLLPLFQELGYGRLTPAKPIEIEDASYSISHGWQHAPIHLVSRRVDLDRRTPGATGAHRSSPHALVQELLNRAPGMLWGFVSNGLRLRVLRDSRSLTRQAFVEFDLAAMMDAGSFADFRLLWLVCHQSRVEGEKPADCWLERWSQQAAKQGTRALDTLRRGVEQAIEHLGRGYLVHPANVTLRGQLRAGVLDRQDYYRQLLRVVYRLIFLFVAEDRGLLHAPDADASARKVYDEHYSTRRLRAIAARHRGSAHVDLAAALNVVVDRLGTDGGCPALALPALGGFFESDRVPALLNCSLSNVALLDAIRSLAFTVENNTRRPIDYKNLGSEELGSVYESLLELHPDLNADAGTFALTTAAGHERKTTGSYYTPTSLVNCLLDTALDPVLDAAAKSGEQAILALKIVDPACGSGHFLIAAAHRVAKRLAAVRTGEPEAAPDAVRHALRDVIGRCIYGVDLNPMAVELCKVALWLDAIEPGKPLSFLDHHIKVGNSLLGTTPALLARGIPDTAFEPIEGDDKAYCREWKKQNKDERTKHKQLLLYRDATEKPWMRLGNFAAGVLAAMDALPDDALGDIRTREQRYAELTHSTNYEYGQLWADAWCAAFVWKKDRGFDYPITEKVFRDIEQNPHAVAPWIKDEIKRLRKQYDFFHWHLAFPDVFTPALESPSGDPCGWTGGFDVVLGNPPWERIALQEKEWFAIRSPAVAAARNASVRKRLIAELKDADPPLFAAFREDRRRAEGESRLIRGTGRYPLAGSGDVNTYTIFVETGYRILATTGRSGLIVPTGIVTGENTKAFFQHLVREGHLGSFVGFDNEEKELFPEIDNNLTFAALTLRRTFNESPLFCFNIRRFEQLSETDRFFKLNAEDLRLVNPNSLTCPPYRTTRDARIVKGIYRRLQIISRDDSVSQSAYNLAFLRMFDMAADSGLFVELDPEPLNARELAALPDGMVRLFEAKMIWQFEHRWASYLGRVVHDGRESRKYVGWYGVHYTDADDLSRGRYAVQSSEVDKKLGTEHQYVVAFRDITNRDLERTAVFAVLPRVAVAHQAPLVLLTDSSAAEVAWFIAERNSFVADFVTRSKLDGSHLTFAALRQLPSLPRIIGSESAPWANGIDLRSWLLPRVLELTYTAWDLQPFAQSCGYDGPPFRWDSERRQRIRCELDAAFFHLYGLSRGDHSVDQDDVAYILDTFRLVCRKDENRFGEYRSKRMVLEMYDEMAAAMAGGPAFQSKLSPLPGPPSGMDQSLPALPNWTAGDERPLHWPAHIHAPRHAQTARPVAAPTIITLARREDLDSIVSAFLDQRDGMSPDYVVAHPDANRKFLAAVRRSGVGGSDYDVNHALLGARKAGKLRGAPTEVEYRLTDAFEPWVFASEWAARHVQRELSAAHGRVITLDDVLCDPSFASRFDEAAARIKPGFAPIDYRWAAMQIRKRSKARPSALPDVPYGRQLTLDEMLGQVPRESGLYLIQASDRPLFVNHAADLADQIVRHREVADGGLIPEWLTAGFGGADGLSIKPLLGRDVPALRAARAAEVDSLHPWLNLDLIA